MRGRSLLIPVVAMLGVAACASEEASPLPTAGTVGPAPVTTATTTTTTPAAPTVTEPTTAAPTTTASTTDAPTTTGAPPSGGPIDATIPLFAGDAEVTGWLPLGTWAVSEWQPATDADGTPIGPPLPTGSTLAISGLGFDASTGVTGDNVEACFDGRLGPTIGVTVDAPTPPGFGYGAIALPANWPLRPRPVVVIDASIQGYQAAGEMLFADAPVDASLGTVEQIVLADLDGDGDEEALVAFEHVDPAATNLPGAEGDFAAILLIDTATGGSADVISSFGGPVGDGDFPPVREQYRVIDVADLNGDGRMEVVLHTWYYEGAAALVYEYDGTSLTGVLGAGCGA